MAAVDEEEEGKRKWSLRVDSRWENFFYYTVLYIWLWSSSTISFAEFSSQYSAKRA